MHNVFSIIFSSRAKILILAVSFSAIAMGCGGAQYAAGPDYSPELHDYLRADDSTAYTECLAVCSESTSLALVTRTGCLEGCEEARRSFPLNGRAFSSRRECLDTLARQELAKADRIQELRAWCDARWTHVHNRKGCYRGIDAFCAVLEPVSMCGNDGDSISAYNAPLDSPRENAEIPNLPSATTDAAVDRPVPSSVASQPLLTPTESTQPAGSFLPPPYEPEYSPEKPTSDSITTPAPLPAKTQPIFRDTPKYQKAPTAKPSISIPKAVDPAPAEKKYTPASPRPEIIMVPTAPTPTPTKLSASPGVSTTQPPQSVTSATTLPVESVPVDPMPVPTQPQPTSPSNPPSESTLQLSPSTNPGPNISVAPVPATPPVPQTTPAVMRPTPQPVTAPAPTTSEPPQAAPPVREPSPAPVPTVSERPLTTEVPSPLGTAQTPTRQGPPVPGLNADRAAPATPEPQQQMLQLPAMMPPVPSMLKRPYNTPAIIAPQIDIPEEGSIRR